MAITRIGIIGTRRRDTPSVYDLIKNQFFDIYQDGDWIVSGGCKKGGDRFAELISEKEGVPRLIFPPNYKKFGAPAALFIRNEEVAKISDVIIACVVKPEDGLEEVLKRKKGGTEDTLRKFVKHHPEGKVYLL
jgi:hypothetical protein